MFPTFVWQMQLRRALCAPANAAVLGLVAQLRGPRGDLEAGAAWQSGHRLHQRPELGALVSCLEDAVRSVLRFLSVGDANCAITGCWANVYPPGAAHRQHTHPNNFLSGVYYVQTPQGADTINFHDPRAQAAIIRPGVTALSGANADQAVVRVAEGMLLVFPAFLPHSVDANRSAEERVSLSFNAMFREPAENLARPLWGEE